MRLAAHPGVFLKRDVRNSSSQLTSRPLPDAMSPSFSSRVWSSSGPNKKQSSTEKNTPIRWKDNVIKYDHIVDADYEIPNLPDIIVDRDGVPKHKYEYICRNNFSWG
jgi:hypothetical protein